MPKIKPRGFASNYRVFMLAVVVFVCFGAVGTRLVFLHTIDREKILHSIEIARRQVSVEKARRGDILDSRGDILATSRSMIVLGVDRKVLRTEDQAQWPALANMIGMSYFDLQKIMTAKIREAAPVDASTDPSATTVENEAMVIGAVDEPSNVGEKRWVKLVDEIPESTYEEIQKLKIRGITGDRVFRRVYPHNQLAAHIIGFVNKADEPAAGIEAYTNQFLLGVDGWRESEKDGRQRELARFRSREVAAANGYSVKLSIDSVIQNWAEEELAELARTYSPEHAVIIVSDAQTGFLLALANYPSFNLNEYNKVPMEVLKNYAITDQIDPGSTFKIVAASAALNDGLVTADSTFDCSSEYVDFDGKRLHLVPDDHRWDHPLSVAEIISHSSNRGAALLAMRVGKQRFYDYARAFGFGSQTGFPFGGEINGTLNPPQKWYPIDMTRIPAGYSISATPMQIHYAMATIASGGELLTPQIISEIRDTNGDIVYQCQKQVQRRVVNRQTAELMARLLQRVVSPDGTAAKIAMPGYQLAGKTGTAQKLIDGRYSKTNHVGSFVGFFPATNPRVVVSIIVDDGTVPNGRPAYGATVAAPSFKRMAEKLIPYLDIKPIYDVNGPNPTAYASRHP